MKEWLKKLKLIDYQTIEIDVQKSDFVNRLKRKVDHGSFGLFSDSFEMFSSSENEYKGEVSSSGFKLKKRRQMFDYNMSQAVCTGTLKETGENLIIDVEINGFNSGFLIYYVVITIFYTIFLFAGAFMGSDEVGFPVFVFPFILFHGFLMYGLPYFIMKKAVKRTKYNLERDLFFIAKR